MLQKHPEGLLEHRLLYPTSRVSDSGWVLRICILNKFPDDIVNPGTVFSPRGELLKCPIRPHTNELNQNPWVWDPDTSTLESLGSLFNTLKAGQSPDFELIGLG